MAANGMWAGAPPKTSGYLALWIVEGILLLFWVGVVLSIGVFAVQAIGLLILWSLGILIMIIMLGLAGHKIYERWTGALIDSRNKFSTSQLFFPGVAQNDSDGIYNANLVPLHPGDRR